MAFLRSRIAGGHRIYLQACGLERIVQLRNGHPSHRSMHGQRQSIHTTCARASPSFIRDVFKKATAPVPPTAPQNPSSSTMVWHSRSRLDEYAWMQLPESDSALNSYLEQENSYTRRMMKGTQRLQRKIAREIQQATEVDQIPPPVETQSGDFVYYIRQNSNGSVVYCRRPTRVNTLAGGIQQPSISEQVLVDSDELMQKSGYELRNLLISDEHDHFACLAAKRSNTDLEAGTSESSTVLVYSQNCNGETKLVEKLTNVFNFVFGPQSSIFYTVLDDKLRAHQILYHRIGQPQLQDQVIFGEPNDECFVDITRTKDKKFHIINSSTLDSSELRIFPSDTDFCSQNQSASNVAQNICLMRARQKNVECFVDHHDNEFVILTNSPAIDSSRNDITEPLPFRLMRAPTDKPSSDNWAELLSVANDERIDDVEIFKNHIVVSTKRQGRPAVIVYNRPQDSRSELALPYDGNCAVRPEPSPQFDSSSVRLSFSSPVHLESVVEYDLNTLKVRSSWSSTPLHIDAGDYKVRQIKVPHSGVSVPMTLIHSKPAHKLTSASPTLVRVYGAYGVSLEPEFRVEDIPLLRRGWTVVLAHVRGGGELGREWYSGGRGLNKANSVEDLLACVRFMLDRDMAATDRLALAGVSAGGLVVGAALNAQPDYFRAATLHVPFVDPLSAMLDPQLPLTSVETAEWGNPLTNVLDYDSICQYAPYENVRQNMVASCKRAPSILVTAGGQDKRVSAWQPAKWVARLRSRGGYTANDTSPNKDPHPKLLLSTSLDAGHFHSRHGGHDVDGGSNSYINAHALRNAFLISETVCDPY